MLRCEHTQPDKLDETPLIEVRVYRFGHFIHGMVCESAEEAADAVHAWEEIDGVVCEVDDVTHRRERTHVGPEDWYDGHSGVR